MDAKSAGEMMKKTKQVLDENEPVETRPPAPTVQVSHEQNHETVNAKGYAEQAAPPRPLYWTAMDWHPLIQQARDAVFALEEKAAPNPEDSLRRQFFQARVAIGTAEDILRQRFKRGEKL